MSADMLSTEDLQTIADHYGSCKVLQSNITAASTEILGYLGEHLNLKIEVERKVKASPFVEKAVIHCFVKCVPRSDQNKADYIRNCNFFKKEYIVLKEIFKDCGGDQDNSKWRPKLLLLKDEIFVFEDLKEQGYKLPNQEQIMTLNEIQAVIIALAKFHAHSFEYEETKSRKLGRPYRIWEDFSKYLQEPPQGQNWRDTGMNAVIECLLTFSKHKNRPDFAKVVKKYIPNLYKDVMTLMKPSQLFRNVIVHRDLWTNNILLKKQEDSSISAVLIDYQTVLYATPMLDISSILFFNTDGAFRKANTSAILELYYETLAEHLKTKNLFVSDFIKKEDMTKAYEESILFGLTQAAIVIPLVVMDSKSRMALYSNPATYRKVNEISRSEELITIAKNEPDYLSRILELFEELLDRYVDFSDV